MYIETLKLKRFRGAQRLPLELDEKLNVFAGMNGAGKSTILDATAILLSWLVNRIKRSDASGRPITENDIRNGETSANLDITLCWNGRSLGWKTARVRKGHARKNAASVLKPVSACAEQIQSDISENDEKVNLPLFAYYPVNRAVLDIPLRIRARRSFGLLSAYNESLTGGANFRTFFEWFREREDLENEARRDQEDQKDLFADWIIAKKAAASFPDPQLQAVRAALSRFMPEFKNLTVRRNPLRMEVERQGERLLVNQLSDGEKCLLAMVGDLARRMAIANPLRDNPLAGEGIILIDEIDLHLHPLWQRMVIPGLIKVFPNCQFLISTHSAHVITHVEPANLFLLERTGAGLVAHHPSESYGKSVERVLEDLMGLETTRPDDVKDALGRIYTQIGNNELEGARTSIDELKEHIGGDPELVKANVLIARKKLIGK